MKNSKTLVIVNALFFAAVMLIAAYWTESNEQGLLVNNFLIALWFASNAYITQRRSKRCD
jgi:hypothetical protein